MSAYRIHEFAALAGVTVKALRHYDRIGLLKPPRASSGYRLYHAKDLERLEQIVALKFLGMPLQEIRSVLQASELKLPQALALQREALEARQRTLARAIRAIRLAEECANPGSPSALQKIIEVMHMQDEANGIQAMKRYYSKNGWEQRRRYYEEGPAPEWRVLYREILSYMAGDPGFDPGSEQAQALNERWFDLSLRAYQGDPTLQTDSPTAWMDRASWPEAMKRRIEEFSLEEVHTFIREASISVRKRHFAPAAWERWRRMRESNIDFSPIWQARVDLFRDIEAAMHGGPADEPAQHLVARWEAALERSSAGDPEIRDGLLCVWADRRNWPPSLRWQEEGLHGVSYERLLRCADFLDEARTMVAA